MKEPALVTRIHLSWLSPWEAPLLKWLAARLPAQTMPDHLTALGVLGSLLSGLAYSASILSPHFLWLAIAGLAINWFGDSLDGNLARHRGTERRHYGFFVDHTTDIVSQIFIFFGLGASPYVRFDIALLALLSYWLAALFTFIRAVATGLFQISYFGVGPTEIRLGLIAWTLLMMSGMPLQFDVGGENISVFSLIIISIFIAVFTSFIVMAWFEAGRLNVLDTTERRAAHVGERGAAVTTEGADDTVQRGVSDSGEGGTVDAAERGAADVGERGAAGGLHEYRSIRSRP